jgi:hypothetical protein
MYNEFISLTFKNKSLQPFNVNRILYLSRKIGLGIWNKTQISESYFKNKDNAFPIKEKLYMFIINILN